MPETDGTSIATKLQSLGLHHYAGRTFSLHRPNHYQKSIQGSPSIRSPMSDIASIAPNMDPAMILFNPHYNKGTAFSEEERAIFHLDGLLPKVVEDLNAQVARSYHQITKMQTPMQKHIFLSQLRNENETLFYRLLIDKFEELLNIVYTSTVGQACLEYGMQFRHAEGMYISKKDAGNVRRLLDNWHTNIQDEVSVICVTDGSRILGLGDLGACGMGIPVAKLSLHVAAGGTHPATTLPVVIDVGTNNQTFLDDPFYLGQRHKRLSDDEFYPLIEEFMVAVKDKWPGALVQFDHISNNHLFSLFEKYKNRQLCLFDDIQGTGAVISAGFLNALKIAKIEPRACKVVFFGCGSTGIGVADQICQCLIQRFGMTKDECLNLFYMIDSKGLVTTHRGDALADFKVPYARKDITENIKELKAIIEKVKPAALIGLSGQANAFTTEVLELMASINERPIIFPLSNPASLSECTFKNAYEHTKGKVIFASGSPFDPIEIDGKPFKASQGNNMYSFPGLGFGAWLCKAERVTDEMVTTASLALADCTTNEDLARGLLYPRLSQVREVSITTAAKVIEMAQKQGVARMSRLPENIAEFVRNSAYNPVYLPWRAEEA